MKIVILEPIGINPEEIDTYKRSYWWIVLRNVMRKLRSSEYANSFAAASTSL